MKRTLWTLTDWFLRATLLVFHKNLYQTSDASQKNWLFYDNQNHLLILLFFFLSKWYCTFKEQGICEQRNISRGKGIGQENYQSAMLKWILNMTCKQHLTFIYLFCKQSRAIWESENWNKSGEILRALHNNSWGNQPKHILHFGQHHFVSSQFWKGLMFWGF